MVRIAAALVAIVIASACSAMAGAGPLAATPTPPPGLPQRTDFASSTAPPGTPDADYTPTPSQAYRTLGSGGPLGLLAGTQLELTLSADGWLSARAGCNYIGARYRIEGNRLVASEMERSLMGCDPEHEAQDQRIADFLGGSPAMRVEGARLWLNEVELVEVDS